MRSVVDAGWHSARVVDLSVTGTLLQTDQPYEIGERVEVEIDFLPSPERRTVVASVGRVVRIGGGTPPVAAIHFDPGPLPEIELSAPGGRGARR